MRALLVHNDNAGTNPIPRQDIEQVLKQAGIEPVYCAHGQDDLSAALAQPFDIVVAAGGDGTVADVVSCLDDIERPIGILPLGGSNNIANALGVDGDWRSLPARWDRNDWVRLDRCEADGPWGHRKFVEAIGSGVLTDAVDDVDSEPDTPEEKQANGREAFRKSLTRAEPFPCKVEDIGQDGGWVWEGSCLMVEVLSIPFVGAHLALAAGSAPGDGLLDVVLVTPDLRAPLIAWSADPDASPCPVVPYRSSAVRLTVHERPFRVDDRCPNEQLTGCVDIRIRPDWVKVLTLKEDAR
ncbi:diacylglycerol kinase [Altererythrobacter xixiisoli]|uniref:Diacylglycerol kinase n=1 Tax=Croceibacterium xixiisoli TaxID=1476466 RepID=A0A6I4TTK1_9SPHN|nr:diacylglycerol kinase family protein [Croceibacterium xixiisoli]MXO99182.1 diacylglycerol kinase [Croceibacterium xixiisoli]